MSGSPPAGTPPPPPESPAESPAASPKGFIGGLIAAVAAYADRPWKAAVVIVLLVLGGAGWIIYENQERLIEAWLTPTESELKTSAVPDALVKLATETDADLAQIWAVDLGSNSQTFVGARRRDGERPVIPSPRRLPIIVHVSDVKALIDVLEGHPICVDLTTIGSPLARRLAERGMKRGCAIPVPPSRESFVGVIYLAWATPPDLSNENVAIGVAREIARHLATH